MSSRDEAVDPTSLPACGRYEVKVYFYNSVYHKADHAPQ